MAPEAGGDGVDLVDKRSLVCQVGGGVWVGRGLGEAWMGLKEARPAGVDGPADVPVGVALAEVGDGG